MVGFVALIAGECTARGVNQRNFVALLQAGACGQFHADLAACNVSASRVGQGQRFVVCRNVAGQVEVDALEVVDIANGNAAGAQIQRVAAAGIASSNAAA